MFCRNFMKTFPIRKYGNITAKCTSPPTQPEASPVISGSSTRAKFALPGPSSTSWSAPSSSPPSRISTLSMRSSATPQGPLPTQYYLLHAEI